MVGEEVVEQESEVNDLRKGAGKKVRLTPRMNFERRPHPIWTYFIRGPEGIKIGKSKAPRDRISYLQSAHASELEILVVVPKSRISEEDAHQRFQHIRISPSREWFRPDPELLAFIEELKGHPEPDPVPPAKAKKTDPVIGKLHRLRATHGDNTPIGHRCSNLAQMIPIYKASTDSVQRASVATSIKRQTIELERLLAAR